MPKPALPTLIKLVAQELETLQQALAENHRAQQQAAAAIAQWQQETTAAYTTASDSNAVMDYRAAGTFQQRAAQAMAQLASAQQTLQQHEATLRQQLQATFAKHKKYELLAARQAQAARQAKARQAQAQLDDLRRPIKI